MLKAHVLFECKSPLFTFGNNQGLWSYTIAHIFSKGVELKCLNQSMTPRYRYAYRHSLNVHAKYNIRDHFLKFNLLLATATLRIGYFLLEWAKLRSICSGLYYYWQLKPAGISGESFFLHHFHCPCFLHGILWIQ